MRRIKIFSGFCIKSLQTAALVIIFHIFSITKLSKVEKMMYVVVTYLLHEKLVDTIQTKINVVLKVVLRTHKNKQLLLETSLSIIESKNYISLQFTTYYLISYINRPLQQSQGHSFSSRVTIYLLLSLLLCTRIK